MQPIRSAVPELDAIGNDSVCAPILGSSTFVGSCLQRRRPSDEAGLVGEPSMINCCSVSRQ